MKHRLAAVVVSLCFSWTGFEQMIAEPEDGVQGRSGRKTLLVTHAMP
jgi:hypothetical protein